MIRKLTYLIIAAASLLLPACGIYDDDMYGPNGEQKVKISFVLALGSSDTPVTKAETWSPDAPNGTVGYGPDKTIGDKFDNTILLEKLQIVFYTTDNQYYSKVHVESWTNVDEDGNPLTGDQYSNLYQFSGYAWIDEEYITDSENNKLKMMVFANIGNEIGPATDIQEDLTFRHLGYGGEIEVDDSKVLVGDDHPYRITLYNHTYGHPTNINPPFDLDGFNFSYNMKLRFTISGCPEIPQGSNMIGKLVFGSADWGYKESEHGSYEGFVFTGDGTYEINYDLDQNVYGHDGVHGVAVLAVDIVEQNGSGYNLAGAQVTIDQLLLDGGDSQDYIPMWGVQTVSVDELTSDDPETERPTIYVLRSMAKVEVELSDDLSDQGYTLTQLSMTNLNANGYCLPKTAVSKQATEFLDLSESFNPLASYLYNKTVSGDAESLVMYVPEYSNLYSPATIQVTLKHNDNGVITMLVPQQAIEFKTYTDGQATGTTYDIHRNHNYRFVITGVNSAGGLKYHLVKIEDLELGERYGFEF